MFDTGKFMAFGDYCIGDEVKPFTVEVEIESDDYDDDTGFPEDEFDRILYEKIAMQLPKDHFDIQVEKTLKTGIDYA